jgi:hypothetical protein
MDLLLSTRIKALFGNDRARSLLNLVRYSRQMAKCSDKDELQNMIDTQTKNINTHVISAGCTQEIFSKYLWRPILRSVNRISKQIKRQNRTGTGEQKDHFFLWKIDYSNLPNISWNIRDKLKDRVDLVIKGNNVAIATHHSPTIYKGVFFFGFIPFITTDSRLKEIARYGFNPAYLGSNFLIGLNGRDVSFPPFLSGKNPTYKYVKCIAEICWENKYAIYIDDINSCIVINTGSFSSGGHTQLLYLMFILQQINNDPRYNDYQVRIQSDFYAPFINFNQCNPPVGPKFLKKFIPSLSNEKAVEDLATVIKQRSEKNAKTIINFKVIYSPNDIVVNGQPLRLVEVFKTKLTGIKGVSGNIKVYEDKGVRGHLDLNQESQTKNHIHTYPLTPPVQEPTQEANPQGQGAGDILEILGWRSKQQNPDVNIKDIEIGNFGNQNAGIVPKIDFTRPKNPEKPPVNAVEIRNLNNSNHDYSIHSELNDQNQVGMVPEAAFDPSKSLRNPQVVGNNIEIGNLNNSNDNSPSNSSRSINSELNDQNQVGMVLGADFKLIPGVKV